MKKEYIKPKISVIPVKLHYRLMALSDPEEPEIEIEDDDDLEL